MRARTKGVTVSAEISSRAQDERASRHPALIEQEFISLQVSSFHSISMHSYLNEKCRKEMTLETAVHSREQVNEWELNNNIKYIRLLVLFRILANQPLYAKHKHKTISMNKDIQSILLETKAWNSAMQRNNGFPLSQKAHSKAIRKNITKKTYL